MLCQTFLHVSRIGAATERRLWATGVQHWDQISQASACLGRDMCELLTCEIENSRAALARVDGRYFGRRLAAKHHWRVYPAFYQRTAFLDIETTGLSFQHDEITTVALFDGQRVRTYVNGENLDDLAGDLAGYELLVTYNGRCFDAPFLEAKFPGLRLDMPHIDLRFLLASLGYRGGLKGCERKLGLQRPAGLQEVDGFLAVRLWHAHLRGDSRALPALLRYNVEDSVNLQFLMHAAYNLAAEKLPIPVETLATPSRPAIDLPFTDSIIGELTGRACPAVSA